MRIQIKNKHCFQWLKAFTERLENIRIFAVNVFEHTNPNIRIERIKAHSNKVHESFDMEYSDFQNKKKYHIKILISEYKLTENKHNYY